MWTHTGRYYKEEEMVTNRPVRPHRTTVVQRHGLAVVAGHMSLILLSGGCPAETAKSMIMTTEASTSVLHAVLRR